MKLTVYSNTITVRIKLVIIVPRVLLQQTQRCRYLYLYCLLDYQTDLNISTRFFFQFFFFTLVVSIDDQMIFTNLPTLIEVSFFCFKDFAYMTSVLHSFFHYTQYYLKYFDCRRCGNNEVRICFIPILQFSCKIISYFPVFTITLWRLVGH